MLLILLKYGSRYIEIRCDQTPPKPKNGEVNCTDDTHVGSRCAYSCNTGYHLSDKTRRICVLSERSAFWNGTEATCTGMFQRYFSDFPTVFISYNFHNVNVGCSIDQILN